MSTIDLNVAVSAPRRALFWAIKNFPNGSIWQTRYICFPLAIVMSTLALSQSALGYGTRVFWFAFGVFVWTFLEYVIHRWVFHYEPTTEVGKALMGRFHIQHHADPADQTQVCIPPVLVAFFWGALFINMVLFGGNRDASLLVTCGIAIMMVIYDICHFSTHYHKATNRLLKGLKKHHMLHHFSNHSRRFGVTSPFWDYVFRTQG